MIEPIVPHFASRTRHGSGGAACPAWRCAILACAAVVTLFGATTARTQTIGDPWPAADDDLETLVREGRVDEIETKLKTRPPIEKNNWIARAALTKGRQTIKAQERSALYARADELFKEWIAELEKAARKGEARPALRLAKGRTLAANAILALRVDPELIDFEASNGTFGDRAGIRTLLESCRDQYRKADRDLDPFMQRGTPEEDAALFEGLQEDFYNARLDVTLNQSWTSYYLAIVHDGPVAEKRALLAQAERGFSELVGLEPEGAVKPICYLALAMSQREQGRMTDAARNFDAALASTKSFDVIARIRYERARGQLQAGEYEDARITLEPLASKDPRNLAPSDQGARLYVQLAHLLSGASCLMQAQAVVKERQDSTARNQSRNLREQGLTKLKQVSAWGAPWPALVRIHISAGADLRSPPDTLSTLELLCTAQVLAGGGQLNDARERLEAALKRQESDEGLVGDLLYELGRVEYQADDRRAAAAVFEKLASEHRSHEKAAQAAALAYELWGRVAESTKRPDDYLKLAEVLRNLIVTFADHPKRDEALWLLPRALQFGGRPDEAAEQFAKLPSTHPRWEEAQFRRALCARDAWELARKQDASPAGRERAIQAAAGLAAYAKAARERAAAMKPEDPNAAVSRPAPGDPNAILGWVAEALVSAGEVYIASGVDDYDAALKVLTDFEKDYPSSRFFGRVLAVRIRAYRGLKQFDEASRLLQRFLDTAPADQAGPTLMALAKGMQDEVTRLNEAGHTDEAKRLAAEAVDTFTELEKWARSQSRRAGQLELVQHGRLEMCYLAGQYDEALKLADALLERNPRSGNYQYRRAQILTAMLPETAPPDALERTQKAWADLLGDSTLRRRAPERYWEARYNWLRLHAKQGFTAAVASAIFEESRWYPDLGGPPWQQSLEALYRECGGTENLTPTSQPTIEPSTQPTTAPGPTATPVRRP